MLTIRWYAGKNGVGGDTESIFEAESIAYSGSQKVLKIWKPGVKPPELDTMLIEGTAYVMNDSGATVAVYNMGDSVPPLPSRPQNKH